MEGFRYGSDKVRLKISPLGRSCNECLHSNVVRTTAKATSKPFYVRIGNRRNTEGITFYASFFRIKMKKQKTITYEVVWHDLGKMYLFVEIHDVEDSPDIEDPLFMPKNIESAYHLINMFQCPVMVYRLENGSFCSYSNAGQYKIGNGKNWIKEHKKLAKELMDI